MQWEGGDLLLPDHYLIQLINLTWFLLQYRESCTLTLFLEDSSLNQLLEKMARHYSLKMTQRSLQLLTTWINLWTSIDPLIKRSSNLPNDPKAGLSPTASGSTGIPPNSQTEQLVMTVVTLLLVLIAIPTSYQMPLPFWKSCQQVKSQVSSMLLRREQSS